MLTLYRFGRAICSPIFRLLYGIKVIGAENEPQSPYVMIANHGCFADPIFVGIALKGTIAYAAKKELTRHVFFRWLFPRIGVIPLERSARDVGAVRAMIKIVSEGRNIGIFPQGTRRPGVIPTPADALTGFAIIAAEAHASVLPVSIVTDGIRPRIFHKTKIIIHAPIPYEEYASINQDPTKREITNYCFSRVCAPFET